MADFEVEVREVHIQTYLVSGVSSPEEAKKLVENDDGTLPMGAFEYSHTLEPSFWTVKSIDEIPVAGVAQNV